MQVAIPRLWDLVQSHLLTSQGSPLRNESTLFESSTTWKSGTQFSSPWIARSHYKTIKMVKKRLLDLSKADLLENQVWEYWMADNIEYVRASDKTEVNEGTNSTHIVLTDFFFNNKTKHVGFCSPHDSGGLDYIQPVVFFDKGQVEFYKESDWTENEKNKALLKLGLNWEDVFPVLYQSRVKCDRKILSGVLKNFNEGE